MKRLAKRVYDWAHTPLGDLVFCIVLGVPLGVAAAWITIVIMCMDWWK